MNGKELKDSGYYQISSKFRMVAKLKDIVQLEDIKEECPIWFENIARMIDDHILRSQDSKYVDIIHLDEKTFEEFKKSGGSPR